MRKQITSFWLLAATFIISTSSYAVVTPSWYLGLQYGKTDTNYSTDDLTNVLSGSADSDGYGGRVYGGYQHNENFALEFGYTYFAKTDLSDLTFVDTEASSVDGEIKQYAIDGSIKALFPLTYGFGVYGRVGIAYIKPKGSSDTPEEGDMTAALAELGSEFNFLYGAGISYDIWPNLVLDFSYMGINGSGDVEDTKLLAVGLQYHFGMA